MSGASKDSHPFKHEVRFPLDGYLPEAAGDGSVSEPARDVPVMVECDVAVFGGGPAGVCAAAAAARAGKRVVLVERQGCLGGLATGGWVNMWHTLYGTDRKTKVIGGLAEEAVRRLQRLGAIRNTADDGETGDWTFCSETAKFVFDDLAVGSGVKLMLHTLLAGAARDGGRITAAFVENKSGRGAIIANTYIDCTGDADLLRRCGVETQLGNAQGKCQAPTLVFRLGGKGRGALHQAGVQNELNKSVMDYNGQTYPCHLWGGSGIWNNDEHMFAGTRVLDIDGSKAGDLTRAEVEARYQLRWILKEIKTLPGWEKIYLLDAAATVGIRESHRILADHTLTRTELLEGVEFPDAVAQGTYPVDIHTPDAPGILLEYLDGTSRHIDGAATTRTGRWDGKDADAPARDTLCWQTPYRSLIPRELDNVLAAGRCIGADHESAGAIRVMINCMQFGQAVGAAAAMTTPGKSVREIDTNTLRDNLRAAGVPLR